jgi:hypothetical protein
MKPKTYTRLLLLILVVCISFFFYSYSRNTLSTSEKDPDCNGKCEKTKAQTEFILFESLSRNLLSANH